MRSAIVRIIKKFCGTENNSAGMKTRDISNAKAMREFEKSERTYERICLSRNSTSTSHIMYGISDEPLVCM